MVLNILHYGLILTEKLILAENTTLAWSCGLNFCPVEEENPEFWRSQARETLQSALNRKINTNVAKNVVLFLGDGELTWLTRPWGIVVRLLLWLHLPRRPTHTHTRLLPHTQIFHGVKKTCSLVITSGMGITTLTAARILKGQLQNQTGEETVMTMDTFPNVGLAKVRNQQTCW